MEGGGGAQLYIIPIELSAKYSNQKTQKVEITLDPIRFTYGEIKVLKDGSPIELPNSEQDSLEKWMAADIVKIADTHYVLGVYKLNGSEDVHEILLPVSDPKTIIIKATLP